jgi:hypothetical protein
MKSHAIISKFPLDPPVRRYSGAIRLLPTLAAALGLRGLSI